MVDEKDHVFECISLLTGEITFYSEDSLNKIYEEYKDFFMNNFDHGLEQLIEN
jgi:hypothetical protein